MTRDAMINSDLADLAADSSREHRTSANAGVYRDDRPGIEAWRQRVAGEHALELARLPLAQARVFGHRVARAAAGAAAIVGAFGVLAMVDADRFGSRDVRLSTLLAVAGMLVVGAYIVGGWIGERVFDQRVQAAADLGKLGPEIGHARGWVGPYPTGKMLCAWADRWAVALVIGGATVGLAVVAIAVVVHVAVARHGPVAAYALTLDRMAIAVAAGGVLVLVPVMLRLAGRSAWMARLVLRGGLAVTSMAVFSVIHTAQRVRVAGDLPQAAKRFVLLGCGMVGLLAVVTGVVLWWRVREQRLLGERVD